MDRQSFTDLIQTKFKMVRIEAGYTQDTMAQTIGLSKKTLVQIEKERVLPNWNIFFQYQNCPQQGAMAKSVRRVTTNHEIPGSSPGSLVFFFTFYLCW